MKIKKILVSQPKPSSEKSPYYELIEKFGVEIEFRPFIKVEGITSREFRQTKVPINAHTAVIFTARAAVDNYFRLCSELRFNVPDTMRYFCINEQIANYLQKYIIYRKRKIFFADGTHADLVAQIVKHNKEKYLFPQSDVLDNKLKGYDPRKVSITNAIMYRTVSNGFDEGTVFNYDMVILFTPSGVKAMMENFPSFKQGEIAIGAMGSKTIDEINSLGLRLDVTTDHKAPSMAAAIARYLEQHKSEKRVKHEPIVAVKTSTERKPLPVLVIEPEEEPKKNVTKKNATAKRSPKNSKTEKKAKATKTAKETKAKTKKTTEKEDTTEKKTTRKASTRKTTATRAKKKSSE